MKTFKIITLFLIFIAGLQANAQTENSASEIEQITETLMNYIDGTGNGEPDKL